ncbi:hypothetical protein ACFVYG_22360 [Streptomyces sp. NPDC058256]|uniref:hypothetical protein n=1 Tax=Streptomyces sp. NPDC058256 TaxID=3346408 RepID=UPI0036E39721
MSTHTPEQDAPVFIEIRQAINGDVTYVAVRDTAPYSELVLASPARHTVWHHDSTRSTVATEVFNAVYSTSYRDDNPAQWSDGRRARAAFNAAPDGERAFLRTLEAHLILAGYIGAHTAPVAEEIHGIALALDHETWHFYQLNDTWHAAVGNQHSIDGWSVINDTLAHITATAAQLADAISTFLADHSDIPDPATTS